jgi:hypothetical protein
MYLHNFALILKVLCAERLFVKNLQKISNFIVAVKSCGHMRMDIGLSILKDVEVKVFEVALIL